MAQGLDLSIIYCFWFGMVALLKWAQRLVHIYIHLVTYYNYSNILVKKRGTSGGENTDPDHEENTDTHPHDMRHRKIPGRCKVLAQLKQQYAHLSNTNANNN